MDMEDNGKVVFDTKVIKEGNSSGIVIPKPLLKYLNLELGDKINLGAFEGKKGKFIAIWKD